MKRDHSAIYLRVLSVSFNFLSVDRKSSPVIASIEWNKMNRDWILAKANMDMGQCVLHVFRKLIPNDLTIYFDWFVELRRNYRTRLHWVSTFAAIMRTLTPHTDSEYICMVRHYRCYYCYYLLEVRTIWYDTNAIQRAIFIWFDLLISTHKPRNHFVSGSSSSPYVVPHIKLWLIPCGFYLMNNWISA